MFHALMKRLRRYYCLKIKKTTPCEYDVMKLRQSGIAVGEGCRIYTPISSNEPSLIQIGNDVTISADVTFVTHDNSILKVLEPMTDAVGPITVGDRCFIGQRSILMLGITLGENCVVGTGSVVTHSFPPHSVIAGNPARRICSTEEMAEKYREKSFDFSIIPKGKRNQYILEHPEKWVVR